MADKIAATVRALELDRFTLKYSTGTLAREHLLGSIERYGMAVAPLVREHIAAQLAPVRP